MPDDGAPRDSRANLLYADEQAPLTWREAWRVLVKSWPFVSRYRRLVAIKCVLVFVSLTFYLMTPWPLKIVIDNVIDGHPLTGIPGAILTPMVGASRTALLVAVTLFLVLTVILIGMVHGDAESLGTNVNSGGLDQAGITANDANDGGSLWNGLFGYLESHVTIDLTQRMNQSLRTAIYERFLRSPLALYADQKIGDAVFRVMYDSASIGPVFYRGVLAPIMSVFMFVMAIDRALDTIQQRAGDHRRRDSVSAGGRNRQHAFRTRDPRSEPVDARKRQRRDGRLRRTRRAGPAHQGVRTGVARDRRRRRRKLAVVPLDAPNARDLFS